LDVSDNKLLGIVAEEDPFVAKKNPSGPSKARLSGTLLTPGTVAVLTPEEEVCA
jgi:hypothetical protein